MDSSTGAGAGRKPRRRKAPADPVPPKTARGRRTRAQLLQGVVAALNKYGYQAMRVSDIAAEAHVTLSLFSRYFRNKADATLEVLHGMLAEFRGAIPAPGPETSFWDRELALHRNYVRLFGEGKTGLLGCYFSYAFGEAAFRSVFTDSTRQFVREHSIAVRYALPQRNLTESAIRPVALALVSMTDNFIYRYLTGREYLPGAQGIDIAWLLAALRHRAFLLRDPPQPHAATLFSLRQPLAVSSVPASAAASLGRRGGLSAEQELKRSDAQVTLQRIRNTTLTLLNRLSYDDLRISDIESETGLTRGVVYYHYTDKRDLVLNVLAERVDAIHTALFAAADSGSRRLTAFESLNALSCVLASEFSKAPGVMRALYHLEERDTEVAAYYGARRGEWARLISRALARHARASEAQMVLLNVMGHAFLAMADRFLYDIYVVQLPETSVISQPEDAATLLAALWHRMAFGSNPADAELDRLPVLRLLSSKPAAQSHPGAKSRGSRATRT
ncbi:MAG TPA: TetR/AcrR family transcriptional regulator [Steroidobacteraceae bacterium]|nr:TetR/AcrR family transcriptional regulator [Steroidobacteraceae bacterium]